MAWQRLFSSRLAGTYGYGGIQKRHLKMRASHTRQWCWLLDLFGANESYPLGKCHWGWCNLCKLATLHLSLGLSPHSLTNLDIWLLWWIQLPIACQFTSWWFFVCPDENVGSSIRQTARWVRIWACGRPRSDGFPTCLSEFSRRCPCYVRNWCRWFDPCHMRGEVVGAN